MENLTTKQEKFAQLVAEGKTYADAYQGAYNVGEKTTKNSIYVKSSRLMDEAKIQLRVHELKQEVLERNKATLDEVLTEMAKWLRFDPIKLFNDDFSIKQIDELPEDVRKCIASFEVLESFSGTGEKRKVTGQIKKVKLIDKRATADMFMKRFGAYITKLSFEDDDISHIKELLKDINN